MLLQLMGAICQPREKHMGYCTNARNIFHLFEKRILSPLKDFTIVRVINFQKRIIFAHRYTVSLTSKIFM